MKRIILGAMAAVAILACSKEQVIEVNRANDEITFNVVTDNQTKAAAVYCANNLFDNFHVSATYTNGSKTNWFFQNDHIVKNGTSWNNETNTRYWSAAGTHDFYAIYNGTMTHTGISEAPAAPQVVDFKVEANVKDQKDLLYAVATGYKKTDKKAVALNFRHALSQVVFQAKNTNPNLYVEISGVSVCNVANVGTFTYPTVSTAVNYVNHTNQVSGEAIAAGTQGTWNALTGGEADYNVKFNPVIAVAGNSNVCALTTATTPEYNANTMLLLPQATTAWNPAGSNYTTGSYLLVDCIIYNVAGTAYKEGTDAVLYSGTVAIPAAFNWAQGKKYIYTFVFGNGNGGYIPGGNEPVLAPIDYTVAVDDFAPVANQDVPMEAE